ncbi:hypothetical protein N7539_006222 [Penicillium diatomitis]|uniref:Mitochondrial thiamine pyrophosphate carrier 1 n=1 Tax=Penicillium diatomitis TaxID=2819901 RepID=A0A9W9X2R5_9EURO|nr:uncharacterized protein N7539_006222 [Penicillium diatomitis]KAJ5482776.1 hypothetical protein N7539_006222 [Penicillium diatomitis]
MAEYKVTYESELDAFHPSFRYDQRDPKEDWKTSALRGPSLPVLGNAVAGALGSAIANVIVYPLNVIVARLQTQEKKDPSDKDSPNEPEYKDIVDAAKKIYEQYGLAGFYPGLAQDTCKSIVDSFLFFLAYNMLRQRRIVARVGPARAAKSKNIMLPIWDELAVGMVAGAFSKLFTTPLSNIVTRKQTAARKSRKGEKDPSTADIAAQIRAEKGLGGFWSGYSAALILTLNPSITFFLNEALKTALIPRAKRQRPSPALTFLIAALSKSTASTITYPFSLAKTRAQALGNSQKAATQGSGSDAIMAAFTPKIFSAVATIYRKEGVSALYAGLPGEVLKSFFSHGFTMLAKDAVYASIVKFYYLLLIVARRYPSPEELLARAREQAEEYGEIVREGAREYAEQTREGAEDALKNQSGSVSVDMTSDPASMTATAAGAAANGAQGLDPSSTISKVADEVNETAELVGDYVEDEAAGWKSMYHWFWDKDRMKS